MKKLLMIAAVAVFGMTSVNAQDFKLGVSAGYLTEIGAIGFGADAVYGVSEKIEIAANATFASEGILDWTAIDLNAHYMFNESFYGLAGVEFLTVKIDGLGGILGGISASGSETGFNAGLGYRHSLSDSISLFGEGKYVAVSGGYIHARVGVLFNL